MSFIDKSLLQGSNGSRVPVEFPTTDNDQPVEMDTDQMIDTFQRVFKTKTDFVETMRRYYEFRNLPGGAPTFAASRWDDGLHEKRKGNFWSDVLTWDTKNTKQKQIFKDFMAAVLYKTSVMITNIEYGKWLRSQLVDPSREKMIVPDATAIETMDMDILLSKFRSMDAKSAWKKDYMVKEPVRQVDDKGKVSYALSLNEALQTNSHKMAGYKNFASRRILAEEVEVRKKQLDQFEKKLQTSSAEFVGCVMAQFPNQLSQEKFFKCFNTYSHNLSLTNVAAMNLAQTIQKSNDFQQGEDEQKQD